MREIKIIQGDVLLSGSDIIVQQVNCVGVMGGGLAAQIMRRYPNVKPEYLRFFNKHVPDKKDEEKRKQLLGTVQYVETYDGTIIANVFGQLDIRKNRLDCTVYTKKDALFKGIQHIHNFAAQRGFTVAIPTFIGCGLANGDWDEIKTGIDQIFANSNVDVVYYQKKG